MIMTKALLALIIAMQAIPQEQREAEAIVPAVGIGIVWTIGEAAPVVYAGIGLAGAWLYKTVSDSTRGSYPHEQPEYQTYHEARKPEDYPPNHDDDWTKLKGDQGYKDKKGRIWKRDPSNHGGRHWEVFDKTGKWKCAVDDTGKIIKTGLNRWNNC